ncbi:type II toxin-antitoxin system RelE/ParE family toxin [Spirosoma flavum]|uniref:Type II toxin-antitoxin system RelE/ParE family toxin n=1 Tax=Spirosoma flavum TaxID=2048557 RepID=A0ABW6AJV3_9BACT
MPEITSLRDRQTNRTETANPPLRLFHEKDDASKLPASQLGKISLILGLLDAAVTPSDMDFPGSGLHKLSDDLKDYWAVKVSGNYRIIFKFEDEGVTGVAYLDYH